MRENGLVAVATSIEGVHLLEMSFGQREPMEDVPLPRESAPPSGVCGSRDQLWEAESRLSLPLEQLAAEWLQDQRGGAENNTYLMDSLLPTLILGLEKLLTEVSDRGLAETEETQYDFNPINLLAQYLMRNNPGHAHLPTGHPYCGQLKQVSQQLQKLSDSAPDQKEGTEREARRTELDTPQTTPIQS